MMASAARVPVLMYHRVGKPLDQTDCRYCVPAQQFVRQMEALRTRGYRAVSLSAFMGWLAGGDALPQGSFLLTFDDGFRGVYEHAYPWLREARWPFTIFIVTGLIGKRDLWNRPSSGGTGDLLCQEEIREMQRQGVEFQSHTRTHAHLPQLSDDRLAAELTGSKADLESLLASPVHYLAYPFGETDARVINAVRAAGYAAAFSSEPGFNRHNVDRYRIRRLDVYGTDSPRSLRRKAELGTNDGALLGELRYKAKRLWHRLSASPVTN